MFLEIAVKTIKVLSCAISFNAYILPMSWRVWNVFSLDFNWRCWVIVYSEILADHASINVRLRPKNIWLIFGSIIFEYLQCQNVTNWDHHWGDFAGNISFVEFSPSILHGGTRFRCQNEARLRLALWVLEQRDTSITKNWIIGEHHDRSHAIVLANLRRWDCSCSAYTILIITGLTDVIVAKVKHHWLATGEWWHRVIPAFIDEQLFDKFALIPKSKTYLVATVVCILEQDALVISW